MNKVFCPDEQGCNQMLYRAAGVLFTLKKQGATYVLLGKSAPGWIHSGKWTLLGGYVEEGESFAEGAAREADEESLGVVMPQDTLLQKLHKESPVFMRTPMRGKGVLISETFLVSLSSGWRIPEKFHKKRAALLEAGMQDEHPDLFEVDSLAWVTPEQILTTDKKLSRASVVATIARAKAEGKL